MKKYLLSLIILSFLVLSIPSYGQDSTKQDNCLQEINLIKKEQCIEIQDNYAKIAFSLPCSALNFYKHCSVKEKFITVENTMDAFNKKEITMFYVYIIFEKDQKGDNK